MSAVINFAYFTPGSGHYMSTISYQHSRILDVSHILCRCLLLRTHALVDSSNKGIQVLQLEYVGSLSDPDGLYNLAELLRDCIASPGRIHSGPYVGLHELTTFSGTTDVDPPVAAPSIKPSQLQV